MNLYKDETKVLIVAHYNYHTKRHDETEDTDARIINYLRKRVKQVTFITQPLPESDQRYTFSITYSQGEKVKEEKFYMYKGPRLFQFLQHILIIYYLFIKNGFNFNLCISLENLSFVCVWPFRKIGSIERLIYHPIDFVPKRFESPILNWAYKYLYMFACKHSDKNWVMNRNQIVAARKLGINRLNSAPFSIVPIGYDVKKIQIQPVNKINLYNIIYVGAMIESSGAELVIEALQLIIKRNPRVKLTLVGTGRDVEKLKKIAKKNKLSKYVHFLGFIDNFWDLVKIIASSSIGLAPYKPIPNSFSYFADPSKIKLYMACGLPVITTNVTTMANTINKTKSGVVINYSLKSLSEAITYLIENTRRYKLYKESAIKLSKNFDINLILDSAFKKIPA